MGLFLLNRGKGDYVSRIMRDRWGYGLMVLKDHLFNRVADDGKIHRVSYVDTEEFEAGSGPTVPGPTVPGFTDGDFSAQKDRIRSKQMTMSNPDNVHADSKAFDMKKEIGDSIAAGYKDLSRGLKIRVLKELLEKLKAEGEERRAEKIGVKRK